jgi:hypothetical protein
LTCAARFETRLEYDAHHAATPETCVGKRFSFSVVCASADAPSSEDAEDLTAESSSPDRTSSAETARSSRASPNARTPRRAARRVAEGDAEAEETRHESVLAGQLRDGGSARAATRGTRPAARAAGAARLAAATRGVGAKDIAPDGIGWPPGDSRATL